MQGCFFHSDRIRVSYHFVFVNVHQRLQRIFSRNILPNTPAKRMWFFNTVFDGESSSFFFFFFSRHTNMCAQIRCAGTDYGRRSRRRFSCINYTVRRALITCRPHARVVNYARRPTGVFVFAGFVCTIILHCIIISVLVCGAHNKTIE